MKVWVVGSNGMLGSTLCRLLTLKKIDYVGTGRDVDITSLDAIDAFIEKNKSITHIVNCAAYTQVDKAEENESSAYAINVTGTHHLGLAARKHHLKMIHISTDYVFAGDATTPYDENSHCQPSGVYAQTKWLGEQKLLEVLDTACIIRTSWLFGLNGKNFVSTMLQLMQNRETIKVVADQMGRPTFCHDLADAIIGLLNHEGIYHFANAGATSWHTFATTIAEQSKQLGYPLMIKTIAPITTSEYPTPAKRPAYSVLNTNKIQNILNYKLRTWQESLFDYLQQYRNQESES